MIWAWSIWLADLPTTHAGRRPILRPCWPSHMALPVFVENDAAAAATGELQFGQGQRYGSFFYVLISSGLGGSLVMDGSLFRGANGRSGELGFLPAWSDSSAEPIQSYVSLSGLNELLKQSGLSVSDLTSRSVPTAETSKIVAEWIEGAAARLLGPIKAVNCLVNPAAVLIGGRLPANIIEQLADTVYQKVVSHAPQIPVICPVHRATFSVDAPAVGAAILPISHFLLPFAGSHWERVGGTPLSDAGRRSREHRRRSGQTPPFGRTDRVCRVGRAGRASVRLRHGSDLGNDIGTGEGISAQPAVAGYYRVGRAMGHAGGRACRGAARRSLRQPRHAARCRAAVSCGRARLRHGLGLGIARCLPRTDRAGNRRHIGARTGLHRRGRAVGAAGRDGRDVPAEHHLRHIAGLLCRTRSSAR